MPRNIKVAAVQMDATPAPTVERLARAERLVSEAAQAGAQLVVLPELFNTGYAYTDANFHRAEGLEGETAAWLRQTAERLGIHLAGTLLLRDQGEIYDSLLLFSPKGALWRYDKNYPWAWERGYFRERRGMTVAQTELGDFGLMICWDLAHPELWKQYAGKVDMMLLASCPPNGSDPTYQFSDGSTLTLADLGPLMASMKDVGARVFGEMFNQQAAWLGVPAVNTGGSGHIQTNLPQASALAWSLLLIAPKIAKHLPHASQMQLACDLIPSCKVVDANGHVLAERRPAEGEGYTLSEVTLADTKPMPNRLQPASPLPPMIYFNIDGLIPFLMRSVYQKGLQQK